VSAYYNENDPFAAAWLRELIKENLIAPGEVDERSIEEVKPDDLRGFTQCHFFAGISGWSLALRRAGWPDDEPVWTGSCPCPPFSSAGTKKACPQCQGTNPVPHVGRTGYFVCCLCDHEWFADARHLWPELWRLVSVCRPVTLFGEQVAGDDGKTWLTLVRASLEMLGYAVGAKDLCSAGFGASDIRQRLYFVADSCNAERGRRAESQRGQQRGFLHSSDGGAVSHLEHPAIDGRSRQTGEAGTKQKREPSRTQEQRLGIAGYMDESDSTGSFEGRQPRTTVGHGSTAITTGGTSDLGDSAIERERAFDGESGESVRQEIAVIGSGLLGKLADTDSIEPADGRLQRGGRLLQPSENPLAGFWSNAEWIYCQDGKYRAVEPGTFPLAHGATNRVGRLRGYGNAINAEVAKGFIEAYLSLQRCY